MSRISQTVVLALLGAYVCRIALTDEYTTYVNDWMRWPLLGAGLILLLVAAVSLLLSARGDDEPEGPGTHDHAHGTPRTAWLMAMPFFVIVLIAPQPLGSYVAERTSNRVSIAQQETRYPAVPDSDEPVAMQMSEFVARALYDPDRSLKGREVELTGFVTTHQDGPGWSVTRISMLCCAADSNAYQVRIRDAVAPPLDSWVRVTGTWVPAPSARGVEDPPTPVLSAQSVTPIDRPKKTYE